MLGYGALSRVLEVNSHLFEVWGGVVRNRRTRTHRVAPSPSWRRNAGASAVVTPPGDGDAAAASLQAAARAVLLLAPDPTARGMLHLSALSLRLATASRKSGSVCAPPDALRAALAAAPSEFELVSQFRDGEHKVAVYLLQQATHGGGGRTRVTQPPAQTPEEAAYMPRLLAWLHEQRRWCSPHEVLACVPPPVALRTTLFLRACAAHQPDAIAVSRGWRFFAGMYDGKPPGPPPSPDEMRSIEMEWEARATWNAGK